MISIRFSFNFNFYNISAYTQLVRQKKLDFKFIFKSSFNFFSLFNANVNYNILKKKE